MKNINCYILIVLIIFVNILNFNTLGYSMDNKIFYDFKIDSLNGETINLNIYNGKVVLLVNVASNCGFTKQYSDLQTLWEKYNKKGLIVLGVPSNQFGGQEPGTNNEIKRLKIIASWIARELKTSLNHFRDGFFLKGKVKNLEGEKDMIPTQTRGIITKNTTHVVYK